jgi:DNA gyrase subunit B
MPDSPDRRPNPATPPIATLLGPADGADPPGAPEIQVLAGQEAIRRRPAMYVGDTGLDGLHVLLNELIDNAMGETLAGICKNIQVTLHADGSASVADDGRGIPVGYHPQCGDVNTLELTFTRPHGLAGIRIRSR